jgi:hypothetical protein
MNVIAASAESIMCRTRMASSSRKLHLCRSQDVVSEVATGFM